MGRLQRAERRKQLEQQPQTLQYTSYVWRPCDEDEQQRPLQHPVRTEKQKEASRNNLKRVRRTADIASESNQEDHIFHDSEAPHRNHVTNASSSSTASQSQPLLNMQLEYNSWVHAIPELRSTALQYSPLHLSLAVKRRQQHLQSVQQLVDQSYWAHKCCRNTNVSCNPLPNTNVLPLKVADYPVTYFDRYSRHLINVPKWQCTECKEIFQAQPVPAGCWPLTPIQPHVWLDLILLKEFEPLTQKEGVSVTAVLDQIQERQELYALVDDMSSGSDIWLRKGIQPRIQADTFHSSFVAYLRTYNNLLSMPSR